MKAPRNVENLAERLSSAAATPLVSFPSPVAKQRSAAPKDTVQVTLRPSRALYSRYVDLAATRSRQAGRVVSAQEIILEVMEQGGQL